MKYKQITSHERYIIAALKKQGLSVNAIAKNLNRHRSSIYRELNRNSCYHIDGSYRPSKAQRRTVARRRRSRRNRHYTNEDFSLVRKLLRHKLSPEQIVGYIRRFKLMKRRISHETIYQYIWRDKSEGGTLWNYLRQSTKQRRKRRVAPAYRYLSTRANSASELLPPRRVESR